MARKTLTDESQGIPAPQPVIEIHATSTPSPPRDLEAELALAHVRIGELTAALEALAGKLAGKSEPEGGPSTGSAVTLVEYRGGRIYERPATVVAVRGGGVLGVVVSGDRERRVVDVGPHDASLGIADRIGYCGYVHPDPLAEVAEATPGLELA